MRIYACQEKISQQIYLVEPTEPVFAALALDAGECSGGQLALADRHKRIDARRPLRGDPAGQ